MGEATSPSMSEAITRLPHRQRDAIVLHYYVDLSVSDTCVRVDASGRLIDGTLEL
jgi:DNA-directed RNA polymerase specialized sigma24 family protein